LILSLPPQKPFTELLPSVHAKANDPPPPGTISPSKYWGTFVGTSGDVEVDVTKPGIAVRVEIPREFLQGVVASENDTHFIESNIRNDFYYYNVVDESLHWTYSWPYPVPAGVVNSDGPCFKPNNPEPSAIMPSDGANTFSLRDPNAPWCVEIWNYLNGTFHTFTTSPPKFIRFHNLNAPAVAGLYNFTLSVADHTNSIGYPDFAAAGSTTLLVPVSMSNDPSNIVGTICDYDFSPVSCPTIIGDKGVAYAANATTSIIVARAYVNPANGQFNITGLRAGTYLVRASAGVDPNGNSYSLSSPVTVTIGSDTSFFLGAVRLNRSPLVCGTIQFLGSTGLPLMNPLTGNPFLAPLVPATLPPPFVPNTLPFLAVTVEATDSQGHVSRTETTTTISK
jgi:hypothetical protein